MAPDQSRSRNKYRFHPYHFYTDSPLRFLRRPADLNTRSNSRGLLGEESQQPDTTPSPFADSLTESSSDPPSHQEERTQTEEDSTLGSTSNPIDLTNLAIHSQTPPRKSATSQNVAQSEAPSPPNLIKRKGKEVEAHSHKASVNQRGFQHKQRPRSDLFNQNRAQSQQGHGNLDGTQPQSCPHENLVNSIAIQPRRRSHSDTVQEVQSQPLPDKDPSNKSLSQPQAPSEQPPTTQADNQSRMIPQKRPNSQPAAQTSRPAQQRRLNPPPTNPPPPPTNMSLPTQIQTSLQSQSLPLPSHPWLTRLISARNPPLPLPSLLATTRARVLAADLTTPDLLDPTYTQIHSFPNNLSNPTTKSTSLPNDVVVQVLDIINISKSKWEQVEEMEAKARGEEKRGREVIRLRDDQEEGVDQGTQAATQFQTRDRAETKATHKLLLQDPAGQKVYGLELFRVEKLGIGPTNIGEKWILKKGMSVSRGVIMLEPGKCVYLGGKVEVWNKAWNEGRLERLKKEAMGGGGKGLNGGS